MKMLPYIMHEFCRFFLGGGAKPKASSFCEMAVNDVT